MGAAEARFSMVKQKKTLRQRFYSLLVRIFPRKALSDMFPELVNRVHIMSEVGNLLSNTKADQTQKPYYTHQTTTCVYHAVEIWKNLLSHLPIEVVDKKNQVVEHEIIDGLLTTPNPDWSAAELWSRWALEMATRGEAPFEVVFRGNKPIEMWAHSPDDVNVRILKEQEIYGRVQSYRIFKLAVADYELDKDEMIFWKFYNPLNPYRGLAPLHALRKAVMNDQLAVAWQYYFFKNQARPDYAIIAPGGLTRTERESYERDLTERFGLTNTDWGVGRPIVLEQGITDVKVFSHPPKDIEWLNQRKLTREEIGGVFGIPRELMFSDPAKFENLEEAELILWTLTMIPLLRFRDERLAHYFHRIGILDRKLRLKTNLGEVWPLRRRLNAVFLQAQQLFGMGVPVRHISDYLGLGLPRYPSDGISNPFGTIDSFDEQGDVVVDSEKLFRRFLEDGSGKEPSGKKVFARNGNSR